MAKMMWFVFMVFSTLGLFVIEVYDHDPGSNKYIAAAIVALFYGTGGETIKTVAYIIKLFNTPPPAPVEVKKAEPLDEHDFVEMIRRRHARESADSTFRMTNAKKSFELNKNSESGLVDRK
jgi:hypothetical protein